MLSSISASIRPSTATSRSSSSRAPSRARVSTSVTSASAVPRHNPSASRNRPAAAAASPCSSASRPAPASRSNRLASSWSGGTSRVYPPPRATSAASGPVSARNRDTCERSVPAAPGGGKPAHSSSASRSAGTTRSPATSSNASTARRLGPPSASSRPSRTACTGPRTRNSSTGPPPGTRADRPAQLHRRPPEPTVTTRPPSHPAADGRKSSAAQPRQEMPSQATKSDNLHAATRTPALISNRAKSALYVTALR
jgi:hypothetical protein